MKTNLLVLIIISFGILVSCNNGKEEEEINPLNNFSYKGQVYKTPRFGIFKKGQSSSNLYEFDLVLMSANHHFTEIEGVGYDITGSTGPIVFLTFESQDKDNLLPGTYDFLSGPEENRIIKASAVLEYTPPGSFGKIVLLQEGELIITETNEIIEINYEFNQSSPFPLIGFFTTSSQNWYD